jgi:protein-tyrosine phosphatase
VDLHAVAFATVYNFRDLGGHIGWNGRMVHRGRLYRSDSLHRLNDADLARFAALGIRSVLDLRRPIEVERDGRIPDLPGLTYHNIHPVHREWNPGSYDETGGPAKYLAERYLDMAEEGIDGLGEALRLIADPISAPLVMHCFAGKDRTGVLSALTLSLLGVNDHDIALDYARSDVARAPLTRHIQAHAQSRALPPPPQHFAASPPRAMLLFLSGLRARYGSVYAYARAAGVADGHLQLLYSHLLG